jgi:hypothetical protein
MEGMVYQCLANLLLAAFTLRQQYNNADAIAHPNCVLRDIVSLLEFRHDFPLAFS